MRVADFGTRGHDLAYAGLDGYDGVILLDATSRGGGRVDGVRVVTPALRVIQISAYRGDGLEEWHNWIREEIATRRPVTI